MAEAFVAALLDLATRCRPLSPAPLPARASFAAAAPGLFTGHAEPSTRWRQAHVLPTVAAPKRARLDNTPTQSRELPQLPPEVRPRFEATVLMAQIWRRILYFVWTAATSPPPRRAPSTTAGGGSMSIKRHVIDNGTQVVDMTVQVGDLSALEPLLGAASPPSPFAVFQPAFTPSLHRIRTFRELALVSRAFAAFARELFVDQLDLRDAWSLDEMAAAIGAEPTLGAHMDRLRLHIGVPLASQPLHPAARARELASVIGSARNVRWLSVSRMPSPRTYDAALGLAHHGAFVRLETLALEMPPIYGDLLLILALMPRLKALSLDLKGDFKTPATDGRLDAVLAAPSPPFTLSAFSLQMDARTRINAIEMAHLLGSSHTIEALAIRYAGFDPTAEHLSVGRAILSRWGSRVVHLELCPSFLTMLGAEGAGWNAAAAAVKAVDPDALPPSLYHAPEPVEAEGETV